jgi:hypothetical protein
VSISFGNPDENGAVERVTSTPYQRRTIVAIKGNVIEKGNIQQKEASNKTFSSNRSLLPFRALCRQQHRHRAFDHFGITFAGAVVVVAGQTPTAPLELACRMCSIRARMMISSDRYGEYVLRTANSQCNEAPVPVADPDPFGTS